MVMVEHVATGQPGDSAQEIRHREDLVRWVRDRMAQYTTPARPMQSEDAFLGGMTVEAYFALPEAERERIWDELYAAAIETSQEHEVKPDDLRVSYRWEARCQKPSTSRRECTRLW